MKVNKEWNHEVNIKQAPEASAGAAWTSAVGTGLSGLAGAYDAFFNARKSHKLAKEKFSFEKAAANRNILNQGTIINENFQNRRDVGLALSGKSSADKATYNANNAVTTVDTSKIG